MCWWSAIQVPVECVSSRTLLVLRSVGKGKESNEEEQERKKRKEKESICNSPLLCGIWSFERAGLGKSQMLRALSNVAPRSVYVCV
jgi:hypothetical protein